MRCDGVTHVLDLHDELPFGRSPDGNCVQIGSARREGTEDTLISRRAGVLLNEFPFLLIRNLGSALPIEVHPGAGTLRRVEPGDELRVRLQPVRISLQGRLRRYVLEVAAQDVPEDHGGPVHSIAGPPTEGPLGLSPERRRDLAAVCAPMLSARPSTKAASYAEAAATRGISRKAMEKRIEHLIADLRGRGDVPGLEPGGDVKQSLCEYAIRTRSVTTHDLTQLCVVPGAGR